MKRKPYRFVLYLLLRLTQFIVVLLPYRCAVFLGGAVGSLAYRLLGRYRQIALDNLRSVFAGEKDDKEIHDIAKGVFVNLGKTAAECLSLTKFNQENVKRLMDEKEFAPVKDILRAGKGVIVIGSHFGNWEMSSICGAAFGMKVNVIGRRIYYAPYNDFLVSIRERKGVNTFYRDDKNILRKSLRVLKANEVLGIVPDQDVDSIDGVFVDFLGKPAYTPTGPVLMAMLSGAPLLPTFTVRQKGRLHLLVDNPIYVESTGNREQDILAYTQRWSSVVEKYIRRYPDCWVWVHRRWKTTPEKLKEKSAYGASKRKKRS